MSAAPTHKPPEDPMPPTCSNPAALTETPRTPSGDVDLLALLAATSGPEPWPIDRCLPWPGGGPSCARPCA